jgi:hypothetical protein
MWRRAPLIALMILGFLWLSAAPASAHSVSGVGATNFETRLRSVTPPIPGLEVKVIESGSRLELRNETDKDIIVVGYNDEPYLRVGPDGVFENRHSPATYLNRSRKGNTEIPPEAEHPEATTPSWHRVSDGHVARWHDHRIHWMGKQNPPAVKRSPGRAQVVFPRWTVQLRQGSTTSVVAGDLRWVPGPSPAPWLLLALAVVALGVLAAFTPAWPHVLVAALLGLVAVDAYHAVGIAFAGVGSTAAHLGRLLAGSLFSILLWMVALVAVRWLSKRDLDGLLAAAFAALFITLLGGVPDVTNLYRSQVPFAGSATAARLAVALTLGLGAAVLATCAVRIVRQRPSSVPVTAPTGPAPPAGG